MGFTLHKLSVLAPLREAVFAQRRQDANMLSGY